MDCLINRTLIVYVEDDVLKPAVLISLPPSFIIANPFSLIGDWDVF
jgi:hypothetical protein